MITVPDTSAIDAAVIALLSNDADLHALMPDGVYWDIAAEDKTHFVIVSQASHEDVDAQTGDRDPAPLWERPIYTVKAVDENESGSTVNAAAARIHALLQGAPLTIAGYLCMICRRTERIRYTEIDSLTAARWQHRGGSYQVWAATDPAANAHGLSNSRSNAHGSPR